MGVTRRSNWISCGKQFVPTNKHRSSRRSQRSRTLIDYPSHVLRLENSDHCSNSGKKLPTAALKENSTCLVKTSPPFLLPRPTFATMQLKSWQLGWRFHRVILPTACLGSSCSRDLLLSPPEVFLKQSTAPWLKTLLEAIKKISHWFRWGQRRLYSTADVLKTCKQNFMCKLVEFLFPCCLFSAFLIADNWLFLMSTDISFVMCTFCLKLCHNRVSAFFVYIYVIHFSKLFHKYLFSISHLFKKKEKST